MVDNTIRGTASAAGIASKSGGVAGAARIPQRVLQRLDNLVQSMESVAVRLDSESMSSSQRTVLRTQFNDIQRQVNRLDGIVAGEGQGARGQGQAIRATTTAAGAGSSGGPSGIELRAADNPVPDQLQQIRPRAQAARESAVASDAANLPRAGTQERGQVLNLVA